MKSNYHLVDLSQPPKLAMTRQGFGEALKELGDKSQNVYAVGADLTDSTKLSLFAEAYPDRYFNVGIAEQNLVTVASGMASQGAVVFCSSYAAFSPGRNWEQIKTTIALNDQPVKIIGSHAGINTGPDGATHQMLEDIALMRAMPNMVVIAPGDYQEAKKATLAMAEDKRPNYMRLSRPATPEFTTEKTPFEIGRAYVLTPGSDVSIFSTGVLTYQALKAAEALFKQGIDVEVVHCPTIKPLDGVTLLSSAEKTGCVLTLEEAQVNGGLGGAVAELLSENLPVPLKRIGIYDRFGESGEPVELVEKFGLDAKHVQIHVHEILEKAGKK